MRQRIQRIEQFYADGAEQNRLADKLEFLRVWEILNRYLPSPPATILDVGGAAGVYAFPLAEAGYKVHLMDLVPLHIEQAKATAKERSVSLESIEVGDAITLPHADESMDAVLMFGPLYHMPEIDERMIALSEAKRVLKPGGILFAKSISRFASTMEKLRWGDAADPTFVSSIIEAVRNGQRNEPPSYGHTPAEFRCEIEATNFEIEAILAVEGHASLIPNLEEQLTEPERRENIMTVLRELETEPTLIGASSHILAVARRSAA